MTDGAYESRQWFPAEAAAASMDAHRVLRVSGADAAAFLQGQLSNDVAALDASPGQFSSCNSPKGRVLAFLRVLKRGDTYWLVVDAGIRDAVAQRLRMFVLRAKVTIEAGDEVHGLAVAGPALPERLVAANLPAPAAGEAVVAGDCVFLGVPGPVPRVEIYGAKESLPAFNIASASPDDLARWDILARLPRITPANQDAHVAQHLNLDELDAINFRKGCYTGQEIVARLKYLGKVKKRARVFLGNGANVGDAVRTEGDRSIGEVVNVAPAGDAQLILAVVNLDDRDKALNVNGRPLECLPYEGH